MTVYQSEESQLNGTVYALHRVLTPIAYILDQVPTEILYEYFDLEWDVAAFIKI